MVNSESFETDGNRQAKDCAAQPNNAVDSSHSPSPVSASTFELREEDFTTRTADSLLVAQAIEPTATKTEYNSTMSNTLPPEDVLYRAPIVTKITEAIVERDSGLTCDRVLLDATLCAAEWRPPSPREGEENVEGAPANDEKIDSKASLFVSVPLVKVHEILSSVKNAEGPSGEAIRSKKTTTRLLCLYCDRTFVSANLRQKHVDRCHSVKQGRRASSRFQSLQSSSGCFLCSALNDKKHSLYELFEHLTNDHASKYFACVKCEERFSTHQNLLDHNGVTHDVVKRSASDSELFGAEVNVKNESAIETESDKTLSPESRFKEKFQEDTFESEAVRADADNLKTERSLRTRSAMRRQRILPRLRNNKLSIKSTKLGVRRLTRLQTKLGESDKDQQKKRARPAKLKSSEASKTSGAPPKSSFFNLEKIFTYKKITDHSIDNLRINSLTFDDVFDKAFFNRIKCNIQDNLQNHIDGKLLENEESDNRISNFEKISPDAQPMSSENFGSEISVNAATPVPSSLLSSQLGEDIESQIEYASKPKKRAPVKIDEVHYKYFTRRKYQASLIANNANRDLSGLDMWTQLIVKDRTQKVLNDKKSDKEMQEYTNGNEYKTKMQVEELNRILDKRGPFEDLKQETTKQAALDKLAEPEENNDYIDPEIFSGVRSVVDELLECVVKQIDLEIKQEDEIDNIDLLNVDAMEIPSFLNLRKTSSMINEPDVDKSDRITLICSSQETENFEISSKPRDKNEIVELTGEWARSRIYVCAACGFKLPNMKLLIEHKNIIHQNVWCQHYEFVGNQSELYRHLSIPGLGKVGHVEDHPKCKSWKRSDARNCTKCKKQCNSLAELHRHILECGEDWSWMLVRKKLKYKPFGAKTRRKRRGLFSRIIQREQKPNDETQQKKKYIKKPEGPRVKPSDADTIQRMLANLPAKRATRKVMSLKDGFFHQRKIHTMSTASNSKTSIRFSKSNLQTPKTELRQRNKTILLESSVSEEDKVIKRKLPDRNNKFKPGVLRKSFRNLSKVFSSKILDTHTNLSIKKSLKSVVSNNIVTRQRSIEKKKNVNEHDPELNKNNLSLKKFKRRKLNKETTEITKTNGENNIKNVNYKKSTSDVSEEINDSVHEGATKKKGRRSNKCKKKIKRFLRRTERKTALKSSQVNYYEGIEEKESGEEKAVEKNKFGATVRKISLRLSKKKNIGVDKNKKSDNRKEKDSKELSEAEAEKETPEEVKKIQTEEKTQKVNKRKIRGNAKNTGGVKKIKVSKPKAEISGDEEKNSNKKDKCPFLEVTKTGDPPNPEKKEGEIAESTAAVSCANKRIEPGEDEEVASVMSEILAKKKQEVTVIQDEEREGGSEKKLGDSDECLRLNNRTDDNLILEKDSKIILSPPKFIPKLKINKNDVVDFKSGCNSTIEEKSTTGSCEISKSNCDRENEGSRQNFITLGREQKLEHNFNKVNKDECVDSNDLINSNIVDKLNLPSSKESIIDSKHKGKLMKKKGLNDCIAMLTSKLQDKMTSSVQQNGCLDLSVKKSVFPDNYSSRTQDIISDVPSDSDSVNFNVKSIINFETNKNIGSKKIVNGKQNTDCNDINKIVESRKNDESKKLDGNCLEFYRNKNNCNHNEKKTVENLNSQSVADIENINKTAFKSLISVNPQGSCSFSVPNLLLLSSLLRPSLLSGFDLLATNAFNVAPNQNLINLPGMFKINESNAIFSPNNLKESIPSVKNSLDSDHLNQLIIKQKLAANNTSMFEVKMNSSKEVGLTVPNLSATEKEQPNLMEEKNFVPSNKLQKQINKQSNRTKSNEIKNKKEYTCFLNIPSVTLSKSDQKVENVLPSNKDNDSLKLNKDIIQNLCEDIIEKTLNVNEVQKNKEPSEKFNGNKENVSVKNPIECQNHEDNLDLLLKAKAAKEASSSKRKSKPRKGKIFTSDDSEVQNFQIYDPKENNEIDLKISEKEETNLNFTKNDFHQNELSKSFCTLTTKVNYPKITGETFVVNSSNQSESTREEIEENVTAVENKGFPYVHTSGLNLDNDKNHLSTTNDNSNKEPFDASYKIENLSNPSKESLPPEITSTGVLSKVDDSSFDDIAKEKEVSHEKNLSLSKIPEIVENPAPEKNSQEVMESKVAEENLDCMLKEIEGNDQNEKIPGDGCNLTNSESLDVQIKSKKCRSGSKKKKRKSYTSVNEVTPCVGRVEEKTQEKLMENEEDLKDIKKDSDGIIKNNSKQKFIKTQDCNLNTCNVFGNNNVKYKESAGNSDKVDVEISNKNKKTKSKTRKIFGKKKNKNLSTKIIVDELENFTETNIESKPESEIECKIGSKIKESEIFGLREQEQEPEISKVVFNPESDMNIVDGSVNVNTKLMESVDKQVYVDPVVTPVKELKIKITNQLGVENEIKIVKIVKKKLKSKKSLKKKLKRNKSTPIESSHDIFLQNSPCVPSPKETICSELHIDIPSEIPQSRVPSNINNDTKSKVNTNLLEIDPLVTDKQSIDSKMEENYVTPTKKGKSKKLRAKLKKTAFKILSSNQSNVLKVKSCKPVTISESSSSSLISPRSSLLVDNVKCQTPNEQILQEQKCNFKNKKNRKFKTPSLANNVLSTKIRKIFKSHKKTSKITSTFISEAQNKNNLDEKLDSLKQNALSDVSKTKPYKSIIAPSKLNIISFESSKLSPKKPEQFPQTSLPKLDNTFGALSPPLGQSLLAGDKLSFNLFSSLSPTFPSFNYHKDVMSPTGRTNDFFHSSGFNLPEKSLLTEGKVPKDNTFETKLVKDTKLLVEVQPDTKCIDNNILKNTSSLTSKSKNIDAQINFNGTSPISKDIILPSKYNNQPSVNSNNILSECSKDVNNLSPVVANEISVNASIQESNSAFPKVVAVIKKKKIMIKKKKSNRQRKIGSSRQSWNGNKIKINTNMNELDSNENSELENLTPVFSENENKNAEEKIVNDFAQGNDYIINEIKMGKPSRKNRKIGQKRNFPKKNCETEKVPSDGEIKVSLTSDVKETDEINDSKESKFNKEVKISLNDIRKDVNDELVQEIHNDAEENLGDLQREMNRQVNLKNSNETSSVVSGTYLAEKNHPVQNLIDKDEKEKIENISMRKAKLKDGDKLSLNKIVESVLISIDNSLSNDEAFSCDFQANDENSKSNFECPEKDVKNTKSKNKKKKARPKQNNDLPSDPFKINEKYLEDLPLSKFRSELTETNFNSASVDTILKEISSPNSSDVINESEPDILENKSISFVNENSSSDQVDGPLLKISNDLAKHQIDRRSEENENESDNNADTNFVAYYENKIRDAIKKSNSLLNIEPLQNKDVDEEISKFNFNQQTNLSSDVSKTQSNDNALSSVDSSKEENPKSPLALEKEDYNEQNIPEEIDTDNTSVNDTNKVIEIDFESKIKEAIRRSNSLLKITENLLEKEDVLSQDNQTKENNFTYPSENGPTDSITSFLPVSVSSFAEMLNSQESKDIEISCSKDLEISCSQVSKDMEISCTSTIEEEIDMNINTVKSDTRLLEDMDLLDLPSRRSLRSRAANSKQMYEIPEKENSNFSDTNESSKGLNFSNSLESDEKLKEECSNETIEIIGKASHNKRSNKTKPKHKPKKKPKQLNQKLKSAPISDIFCEICQKCFTRVDTLAKHRMTLTHIAKLSEIEAIEAAKKLKVNESETDNAEGIQDDELEISETKIDDPDLETDANSTDEDFNKCTEVNILESCTKTNESFGIDINLKNILKTSDSSLEQNIAHVSPENILVSNVLKTTNDTLKLADIINDVLNKPVGDVTNFSHQVTNEKKCFETESRSNEIKRYKSLGERKSFDSDTNINFINNIPTEKLSSPKVSTNTDSILEKQISILENIIEENKANLGYADDISIISVKSESDKSESSNAIKGNKIQPTDFSNINNRFNAISDENRFVKPHQFEEISNDSSKNHYEEQRSRKALNHDEELFLECCSLLKSSSEISSYSKKSSRKFPLLTNSFSFKQVDEPEWLEKKRFNPHNKNYSSDCNNFSSKCNNYSSNCNNFDSDVSRMNTPIGESFADDYSNSNTISTEWQTKSNETSYVVHDQRLQNIDVPKQTSGSGGNYFNDLSKGSFDNEEDYYLDKDDDNSFDVPEENEETKSSSVSNFEGLMVKTLRANSTSSKQKTKGRKREPSKTIQPSITEFAIPFSKLKSDQEESSNDIKKLMTKGAMKIFEGLKVSIPTEDLDMTEVLNSSSDQKRTEQELTSSSSRSSENKKQSTEKSSAENRTVESSFAILEEKKKLMKPRENRNTFKNFGNQLGLKIKKKQPVKIIKPVKFKNNDDLYSKKSLDVYDFEETQDNADVDVLVDLKSFREHKLEKQKTEGKECKDAIESDLESDSENNQLLDTISFEAKTTSNQSTDSISEDKKSKDKNITKNKCMIMGRIFKNAAKSKTEEEMRDTPSSECSETINNFESNLVQDQIKKKKLSDQEMNILFNKLLEDKVDGESSSVMHEDEIREKYVITKKITNKLDSSKLDTMTTKNISKSKSKMINKSKKRCKPDDSSDDEFNISTTSRKRSNKKNSKDESINLEQELKECIGVASRKSQRKCTSGKQNVLVEYWSSDDSNFEALLSEASAFEDEKFNERQKEQEDNLNIGNDKVEPDENVGNNVQLEESIENAIAKISEMKSVSKQPVKKTTKQKCKKSDKKVRREVTKSFASSNNSGVSRRKRSAADTLYYWSSSSEDDFQDMIEVKPIREEGDDEDRPIQHGWIVGDSPKKLVTMLAQAKGKKLEGECVKEQFKKRTSV